MVKVNNSRILQCESQRLKYDHNIPGKKVLKTQVSTLQIHTIYYR